MKEAHVTEVTSPEASQSKEQTIALYVLGVILALVAGYYISTALIPTPKIGIINLQTQVGGVMVEVMSREINYARQARDIKGVVLVINSPGGGAAAVLPGPWHSHRLETGARGPERTRLFGGCPDLPGRGGGRASPA